MSFRFICKRNLRLGFWTPTLTAAVLLFPSQQALAQDGWENDFLAKYPQAGPALTAAALNCTLCHTNVDAKPNTRNAYGLDLEPVSSIDSSMTAAEELNSDGDVDGNGVGCNNITEINADTLPADPNSTPASCGAPPNQAPIADAGGGYNGTVGVQLSFDGSGSDDPDGTIIAYDWTFGDGNTGTGVSATHTYAAVGEYDVSLIVTDNGGATSAPSLTTASIVIPTQNPIADPNGPYSGTEGEAVIFDGSGSFDPDGGAITQYLWDFGDGNSGTGVAPSHAYATAGSYIVTLTVVDDEGEISVAVGTTADITAPLDSDGDGIADDSDNCSLVPNPDQTDTNGDNFGNACDGDLNDDNIVNNVDLPLFLGAYGNQNLVADFNNDLVVNNMDLVLFIGLYGQPPGPSGLAP